MSGGDLLLTETTRILLLRVVSLQVVNDMTSKIHFSFMVWPEASTPNGPESQLGVEEDAADKDEEGSEAEWEQVGPRNKTSITRQADFVRTPITDIFGGHIR